MFYKNVGISLEAFLREIKIVTIMDWF